MPPDQRDAAAGAPDDKGVGEPEKSTPVCVCGQGSGSAASSWFMRYCITQTARVCQGRASFTFRCEQDAGHEEAGEDAVCLPAP
eukprot:2871058-Prymnesium_polylepis.1